MSNSYRNELFERYASTHADYLERESDRIAWFAQYARANYVELIPAERRRQCRMLEIGCGKGFLLHALADAGFGNLTGVDLSPDDVEYAKRIVPEAHVLCADGVDFLGSRRRAFDVIVLKAVLEHVVKRDVLGVLQAVHEALDNEGIAIVDVPNMDWLFAPHERYMDFTHEVGFTKESLRQVMNCFFGRVEIRPVDQILGLPIWDRLKLTFARAVIGKLLMWADGQGAANPIWARGLIGIGRKTSAVVDAASDGRMTL
jgi:SAM-dependent methyltransferase